MALKHAAPGQVVDLRSFGSRLAAARTSAIVRMPSFEAVRLVVPAGTEFHRTRSPARSPSIASRGTPSSG